MTDDPPAALIEHEVRRAEAAGLGSEFARKVAANALAIAERERRLGPAGAARAADRLAVLLEGRGEERDRAALLCAAIREGSVSLDDPALVEHLVLSALDKLAIDQPAYPGLVALLASREDRSA